MSAYLHGTVTDNSQHIIPYHIFRALFGFHQAAGSNKESLLKPRKLFQIVICNKNAEQKGPFWMKVVS